MLNNKNIMKTKCFIGVILFLLKVSLSFGQANIPLDSLTNKKDSSYYKGVGDAKKMFKNYIW